MPSACRYYLAMGAEFSQADFHPSPDVFAAKVAKMLHFGAQLGWFSLGGRDNQDPPMALFDDLMSRDHDEEIAFLSTLARTKLALNPWLQHGLAMRALPLVVNGSGTRSAHSVRSVPAPQSRAAAYRAQLDESKIAPELQFERVMSSAWLAANGSSLLLLITPVERAAPAHIALQIDLDHYGFESSHQQQFRVVQMQAGLPDKVILASVGGGAVSVSMVVPPRGILALRVEHAEKHALAA
jgi:hypothetical protein